MVSLPALCEIVIPDEITQFMLARLESYKRDGFATSTESTSTVGGFQTPNMLELGDPEVQARLDQLRRIIEAALPLCFEYHWAHLIDYQRGGFQRQHDHCHNEDYSFILYLSSSASGQTRFMLNSAPGMQLPVEVSPARGKLALFLAQLKHAGRPVSDAKQVLVGGLRVTGSSLNHPWSLRPRNSRNLAIVLTPERVPMIVPGVVIASKQVFDDTGVGATTVTVTSAHGELFTVTAQPQAILAAVDGLRTIDQIVAQIIAQQPAPASDVMIFEHIRNLVAANIVALRPRPAPTGRT